MMWKEATLNVTSGNQTAAGKYSAYGDTYRCSRVCDSSTASLLDVGQSSSQDEEARSHEFSTS